MQETNDFNNTTRIRFFDELKGFAIMLVVIGHVMQFSFGFKQSNIVDSLSIFHMPLFFVISGYFALKKNNRRTTLLSLFIHRTVQLLIPLCIWSCIFCLLKDINLIDLIQNNFGGYWFLWVLWIISILFLLINNISNKIHGTLIKDVSLIVLIYIAIIIMDKLNLHDSTIFPLHSLTTYYRYYAIGYLIHKYTVIHKFLLNKYTYPLGCILFLLQWYFIEKHNIVLIFLGGLGAILFLYMFFKNKERNYKLLYDIGQITLPIYCCHYLLIPDMNFLHNYLSIGGFTLQLLASLILSLWIIYLCWVLYKCTRRDIILNLILWGNLRK